ncbi:MAG: LuxR C-terminal-related transcriptional regulator, partial [Acidimicrobiales bacterium]
MVLADVDGAIVYANPAFYELQGDDAPQICRDGLASLSGISLEAVENLWRKLRRGEPWQKRLHSRNGRAKNYRCCSSIFPLKNAQGRVTHVLGCHVVCGDHDAAENALRSVDGGAKAGRIGDGWFVTVVDRDERIVYNKCVQPGLSNADLIGKPFRKCFPPEQEEVCAVRVAEVFRTGTTGAYHILATGAFGAVSHYESWIGPLSSGSKVIAVVLLSHEVVAQDMNGEPKMISSAAGPKTDMPLLTARELEVLELIAHGLKNSEIGARLEISVRTAERHIDHILGKLG